MKPNTLNRFLIKQLLAAVFITSSVHAAITTKTATGTDLTLAASWAGGSGPGFPTSADVATWNSTSLGVGLTVGADVAWGSINVSGATGAIGITGGGKITTGNITLAGSQTLTIGDNIELSGDSTYNIADVTSSSATDATLSGAISGGFGITKSGGGTLILSSSSNSYTGATTVTAGTLNLAPSAAALTSAISVGSGATLTGSGTTTGDITLAAGSNIIAAGPLSVQGANVAVNATTNIFVTSAPTGSPATVPVISYTGTMTGLGNFIPATNYRAGSITDDTLGTVSLTYTGEAKTWGDAAGTWEIGTTSQWTGGSDTRFYWGDSVAFGAITGDRIVTLNGKLAPTSVTVSNAANTCTFSGTGEITGPCSLTKSGAGTLTLSTANTYTGTTTVSAGQLNVTGSGTLGAGTGGLTMGGVTLDLGGTNQTVGAVSVTAASTIQNGSLTGTSYAVSNTTGTATISANLLASGAAGLAKSGAGTLALSGANTYTGTTTISGGTLSLLGGNNRLATTGTVNFSAGGTLNVGSTEQSLDSVTVNTATTCVVTGTTGSKLTLTGTTFRVGSSTSGTTTQNLNMGGATPLSSFTYANSAGTFNVGNTVVSGSNAGSSVVTLGTTNVITASEITIAKFSSSSATGAKGSNINMGQTNTLNADTITIGSGDRMAGTLQYASSSALTSPSLAIRGTAGGTSRANMLVGSQLGAGVTLTGAVNLTSFITGTSTLDAMLGTLTIGQNARGADAGGNSSNVTGTFTMGGGTLDATNIVIGQINSGLSNSGSSTMSGTFTLGGGTVTVGTLTLGNQNANTTGLTLNSTFNVNNGGTLRAQTIQAGTTDPVSATISRALNLNDGTITTYDAATDLTLGSGITVNLAATGTHTINIGTSRTATVAAVLANTTEDGALVKFGNGTLILNGANTHSGNITISGGTLQIGNAIALGFGGRQTATGNTTVGNGFTLDLNGSATVNEPLVLNGTGIGGNGALVNSNTSTTATIGNDIAGLSLPGSTTGSAYSAVPTVTINGTGSGATAIASLGLTTASMTPTFPGGTAGWVVGDTLSVTGGGGSGAIATVTSVDGSGKVTGLSMTTAGVGYTVAPTALARLTGVGTGTVTAAWNTANFTVSSVAMTNAGTGYTGTPTYTFGSGNASAGTVNLSSVVLASNSSIGGPGNTTVDAVVSQSGGAQALTKVGSGTLTLNAVNTYTGSTTVSGGILSLSTAYLSDTAAVVIGASGVLNLTHNSTDLVGSLTINGVLKAAGVYDSTNSGGFITGTGKLQVSASGYGTWATTNAGGQASNLDFDNDGVKNGVEYFMGQTGSTFTTNPGIVSGKITWPKDPAFSGTYTVQTSPDLVNWTNVSSSVVGNTVEYTVPTGQGTLFVRLDVVPN